MKYTEIVKWSYIPQFASLSRNLAMFVSRPTEFSHASFVSIIIASTITMIMLLLLMMMIRPIINAVMTATH